MLFNKVMFSMFFEMCIYLPCNEKEHKFGVTACTFFAI